MSHETTTTTTSPLGLAVVSPTDASAKVEVIVYTTKSDKTLKQNMNAKDDTLRKRTSLIIVPQQVDDVRTTVDEVEVESKSRENGNGNNRNSVASMDSCVSNTTSQSNQSSSVSSSASSSSSGSDVDAHAAYQDLQNGNTGQELHSPTSSPRCHSSSSSSSASESTSCCSSADYSLREQLKNFANRNSEPEQLRSSGERELPVNRLLKGMSLPVGGDQQASTVVSGALTDALMSPQEVPLGRRYAEVAQFKGGHPKARTSEPLTSVGVATSSSLETAASADSANSKTINNNIHHNGGQSQPQKSQQQQQQLSVLSKANLNNNNNNSKNPNSQNGVASSMTSASNVVNQNQSQNGDSRRSSSLDPDADDVVDMAHNGGAFEDDMEALLPKCSRRSRDELSQVSFS
ncbi:hypothetical protein KR054_011729, partial [Drosophila jambulina]